MEVYRRAHQLPFSRKIQQLLREPGSPFRGLLDRLRRFEQGAARFGAECKSYPFIVP